MPVPEKSLKVVLLKIYKKKLVNVNIFICQQNGKYGVGSGNLAYKVFFTYSLRIDAGKSPPLSLFHLLRSHGLAFVIDKR